MRRLFKWALRLTLALAVVAALLFLFKDSIVRFITERRIREATGMDASIGSLSVGILSPTLTFANLKLYNTAEFGRSPFLIIPELHLEWDPVELAEHKIRITTLKLDLSELDIVKNAAGKTNVVLLADHVEKQLRKARARKRGASWKFDGIDKLDLSLGSIQFVDLGDPRKSRSLHFDLHDQVVRNVRSEADLYGLLLLLWVRSGGELGITPQDFTKSYLKDKVGQPPQTGGENAQGGLNRSTAAHRDGTH